MEPRLNQDYCHRCGSALDSGSKFCQQCGQDVRPPNLAGSTDSQASPHRTCPNCNEQVSNKAAFCANCHRQERTAPAKAATDARKKNVVIVIAVCVVILAFYFVLSRNTGSGDITSRITTPEGSISNIINKATESDANKLTNAKVEDAIGKMTGNLRVTGSISVDGVQELPQEKGARADLRFSSFEYKADQAGTPVPSDMQAPKKPEVNSPNFYDEMFKYGTQQIQVKSYSGPGFAVIKHYSDDRWVLKEVHWQFHSWVGAVDIR